MENEANKNVGDLVTICNQLEDMKHKEPNHPRGVGFNEGVEASIMVIRQQSVTPVENVGDDLLEKVRVEIVRGFNLNPITYSYKHVAEAVLYTIRQQSSVKVDETVCVVSEMITQDIVLGHYAFDFGLSGLEVNRGDTLELHVRKALRSSEMPNGSNDVIKICTPGNRHPECPKCAEKSGKGD